MSWDKMEFAAASLRHKLTEEPQVGLVLGSGLGGFAETLENPVYVDYKSIRDFPVSTVEGHKGRFVIGKKHGIQIIAMQGRVHRYEGFSARDVVFPIRTKIGRASCRERVENAVGAGAVEKQHSGRTH